MTAQRGATKAKSGVFDLDAARAARREALGEGFSFTFGGDHFSCVPTKEWPVQVLAELSAGDLNAALSLILGEDQYETFMSHMPTTGDVEDLMDALGEFSGLGNSGN